MIDMTAPVSELPHVGAKTAEMLSAVGIYTIRDLLYYLPRTYDNYQTVNKISELKPGRITVRGYVESAYNRMAKSRHLNITEAVITDGVDSIRATWFNQPYRVKQFDRNREYIFSGLYEFRAGRYNLTNPVVRIVPKNEGEKDSKKSSKSKAKKSASAKTAKTPAISTEQPTTSNSAAFQPVYPANHSLKPEDFKKILNYFRPHFAEIPDLLPMSSEKPDFVKPGCRSEALFKAHFAENQAEIDEARNYLAYEELFELILAARLNELDNQKLQTIAIPYNDRAMHQFLDSLPFQLTPAQKSATWQIIQDLGRTTPMNRLLQGDVGAGKTVVAAAAAYQAIKAGHQVALLAPTSVLATQHAESLDQLLHPLGVTTALLIGSTSQKASLKARIANGQVDLIIGTHAILTETTTFKDLQFCIIDEQHRFGVSQRQKLLSKSVPHLLMMTATPIPRSLQLTIFGDLDVSTIKELPNGRQPIKTKALQTTEMTDALYPQVREELKNKHQIYWICKNIEDSPTQETMSVKRQAAKLTELFPHAHIEFLHGRMKPAEKDQIMTNFSQGKIDILVSTTVVEVGVNVPNATLMVIMDAEHYGLAQLHQLRGRVGRGQHQSYCYLITESEKPTRRLREMERSTDGFHLAEVDLKIRGPGEIYGSLQHGALDLRIATLSDTQLISLAQKHVATLVKQPENVLKYKELSETISKYQQLTTLN